jgi:hypothetical protein
MSSSLSALHVSRTLSVGLMASTLTLSGLHGRYLTKMIIYAITSDYEAPFEYFANKVDAEKALASKPYNTEYDYIIEIEVK